jgi:hypothetical protein
MLRPIRSSLELKVIVFLFKSISIKSLHDMMMRISGDSIIRSPLMESVAATKEVGKALGAKDWDKAFRLRGQQFGHAWAT